MIRMRHFLFKHSDFQLLVALNSNMLWSPFLSISTEVERVYRHTYRCARCNLAAVVDGYRSSFRLPCSSCSILDTERVFLRSRRWLRNVRSANKTCDYAKSLLPLCAGFSLQTAPNTDDPHPDNERGTNDYRNDAEEFRRKRAGSRADPRGSAPGRPPSSVPLIPTMHWGAH